MRFRARLGNQAIDFSDFWYVTSLIYYLKYGIGSFARKIFLGQKWRKRCENMRFRPHFGNLTSDFSDFWYVTSLIYYFEYGISSFARKKKKKG